MPTYQKGDVIYENPLERPSDVDDWIMEGDAAVTFPRDRMRMENLRDPEEGQNAHLVHWCPEQFPDDISVSWDFWPIREPGLCMIFFAARGRDGEDAHDPSLEERTGRYDQYHHGDIDTLHLSYFRRKATRAFQTVNLRKSHGFDLVAQGADPLPSVAGAEPPYHIELAKAGPEVTFSMEVTSGPSPSEDSMLQLLHWEDDGETHGPVLDSGKIGFRQMAPMMAEYANLTVHDITS